MEDTTVAAPEQEQPPKKLSVDEFAQKVKAKYPEYDKVDNADLTKRIVDKYPEYAQHVDMGEKKKAEPKESTSGSNSSPGFKPITNFKETEKTDYSPFIQTPTPMPKKLDKPIAVINKSDYNTVKGAKLLPKEQEDKLFGDKVKPQKSIDEAGEEHKNQWNNVGNFVPQTVMAGLDKDAGQAIKFLGDKLLNQPSDIGARQFIGDIGLQLEGWGKKHEQQAQQNALPNTTAGNVASSAIGFVPDLMELAATPELDVAKIGKLGDVLAKYGGKYAPKVVNMLGGKFPTLMATKGLTSGYTEGKEQGLSDYDATKQGLVKSAEEYGKGVLFEGAGKAASKLSKTAINALEDAGLMKGGKLVEGVQKSILHSAAQATAFSAVPFITNAAEGKTTSLDELKNNAVFGGILGLFHGESKEGDKPTASDGSAKEVLQRSPLIDLHNFMQADIDGIKYAHDLDASPADLQMKAATHAENAFKESDPETKQQQIVQSSLQGKLASVKAITNAIAKDKNGVIESINDLPGISDADKQTMVDKVNEVHKAIDPVEQQKTAIGNQIGQLDEQIKQLGEEKPDDAVKQAENEVKLEDLTKQREELNNNLKQLIVKQNESNEQKGVAERPANSSESEEAQNKDEAEVRDASNGQEKGNEKGEDNVKVKSGEADTKPEITKREKIADSEAPEVKELSRNLKETGKPGISIEPSYERAYEKPNDLTEKELDNGNKYVVSRDKEGKVNGVLEISYNGKERVEKEPTGVKVAVDEDSRRKGVATALFNHAEEQGIDLSKVRGKATTDAGQALYESNLKSKEDAIQKQSIGKVDVQPKAENGEEVGRGNTESEKPAKQGEKEKGEEKVTGIKKAISENIRIQRELPEVKLSKLGSAAEVLKRGKEAVDNGIIKPAEVVDKIIKTKGGTQYTNDEAEAMQYYSHQLAQQEKTLSEQLSEANNELEKNPDNKEAQDAKILIQGNREQLQDAIAQKYIADRLHQNAWGKSGNILQIEADEQFSPANIRSIIADNYGGSIPKDVEERLKKAEDERDKALSDLKKAQEVSVKKNGEKVIKKIKDEVEKKGIIKQTKAELEEEATQLLKDLRKALKSDFGARLNTGIPLPTETIAVLGKLAVNYFKQGIKDFEGLTNKIYDELKDHVEGLDKKQVRQILSDYEPLREQAKQKEIERLGTKERAINKQLETGKIRDYSRKPKIVFPKDNEVIKAEQRVADAEYKLKQEKEKSYKAYKNKYQRALGWIVRWERRSVLANPKILEKLASAATIGGAINRIPKQLIGGAYSAIFKGLAEKAPIEGGLNMNAEMKFWKEFTNLKKLAEASKEILKTGASPLSKRFKDNIHEHYAGYDALMDLHAIVKDPPKRATFEASLKYAYEWAAKNGLDYQDPQVKRSLELSAFKRAEYEIFQENNGIAKRVNDFINSERKRNNVEETKKFLYRFLIPISTVPLNIARRLGSSIAGLPHGLYLTREAYKAGIDNLTPEQADFILRQVKNGAVGLAYFSIGLFSSKAIMGGVWNKDDKKGKKSSPNQAAFDEMKPFGHPIDKRIQHAMPLFLMQLGATTARVYNHYMDAPTDDPEYQTVLKSVAKAMMATSGSVVDEIPMVQEPIQAVESLSDPYERNKFGEDLKRRVGFSIAKDLGITKKDVETPLDKKLKTVTNDEGDKVTLTPKQLKERKGIFDKALSENKTDWTEDFNDDWENDKNTKERDRLSAYWHKIGRPDTYIRNKFADMKEEKLNQYLEKQAVEYSADEMDLSEKEAPKKNTYSIK